MSRPIFISFEGVEGSGKTSQATILHDRLIESRHPTILVHEPGSTELGWYLRRYLKSEYSLSKEAELLLFAAARVELVNTVIKPSLKEEKSIIADRFVDSSIAYQGYGRKINLEDVQFINSFATGNITPDVTFLLDIHPEEGLFRIGHPQLRLALEPKDEVSLGRQEEEGQRQFEERPLDFHRRVREGYLQLAKQNRQRWIVIDASYSVETVSDQIWRSVAALLKTPFRVS